MSSRESSDESAVQAGRSRSCSFNQTLIDLEGPVVIIKARVVGERELSMDDIQWLIGPGQANSLRSVGISPAYSQSGGLRALACAHDTRILIIRFHGTTTRSSAQPWKVERRNLLEKELLCNPLNTLYAFDLAPLALLLRLHLHIHVTDAIDIQSALQVPGRSIVDAVRVVIADTYQIFADKIRSSFERMLYKAKKDTDLTDLVQRAWLCGFIGQYDSGVIKDMFYKAPKIDMKNFSDDELTVLEKMQYNMLRQDHLKPQSVTHKVQARRDYHKGRMVVESHRFANRMTSNAPRVEITVPHGPSTSFSLPGNAVQVYGKSAYIEAGYNLEGKPITTITSHGKEAPTQAESNCGLAILATLQGTLALFDNHWIRALWLPNQPVNWPESSSSLSGPPIIEIKEHSDAPLNGSQHTAVTRMLSSSLDTYLTLVQGPPGTGKTTVIATYVLSAIHAGQRGIWLMAQSNVAVKNIAEKLAKLEFFKFKLLVSRDFYREWHEHLYEKIKNNIIVSDELPKSSALQRALQGSQVILCTLSMISNPRLQDLRFTEAVPIINVIIDEASQIEVGQYLPLFVPFGKTLRKLCFIGDNKQLPPYGQEDIRGLQSIFELPHLKDCPTFLDTQYRMPLQIGDFISRHVYDGQLKSNPSHIVPSSAVACRFVDVKGSEQHAQDDDGKSSINKKEVDAIVLLARHLQDENISYRIITPYDAQRSEIERTLEDEDLDWRDKCFNVDSFQGNEDHVIIISVVRTKALGFLTKVRRNNVMLTRCQRGMYIVSNRAFLEGKGAKSLVGKMAAELGKWPGAWLTYEDLENGKFE